MKKISLFLCLTALLSIPALAQANFTGKYNCAGIDPFDGHVPYKLVLVIGKTDNTYNFSWSSNGTETFNGTGTYSDANKQALATFKNISSKRVGAIIYNVMSNGELRGFWTYSNEKQSANEICKKA